MSCRVILGGCMFEPCHAMSCHLCAWPLPCLVLISCRFHIPRRVVAFSFPVPCHHDSEPSLSEASKFGFRTSSLRLDFLSGFPASERSSGAAIFCNLGLRIRTEALASPAEKLRGVAPVWHFVWMDPILAVMALGARTHSSSRIEIGLCFSQLPLTPAVVSNATSNGSALSLGKAG